jgi:hypothetical protein
MAVEPMMSVGAIIGAEPNAGPQHDQDASLVVHEKINNRNRRLRRRFQSKVIAIDGDLHAGGARAKQARRFAHAVALPRASPALPQN